MAITVRTHNNWHENVGRRVWMRSLQMTDITADNLLTANQYRKQAADCREQSERALNSHHKESWLRIAVRWQNLAEMAETYLHTGAPA